MRSVSGIVCRNGIDNLVLPFTNVINSFYDRQEFFRIILSVEMDVVEANLPESRVERSQNKLDRLGSYQSWKESEDGIKAAEELAAQRREVKKNG